MTAEEALGKQWHPNVDHYQSGGMGHREGDESRSVVGFVPTHILARYREHGGDWNGEHSDKTVASIRSDIRSGKGITNPLMLEYSPKHKWAYLGEGNHRLHAAELEGSPVVPVRVVRSNVGPGSRKESGVGAPLAHEPHTWTGGVGEDYVPSDMHPSHLFRDRRDAGS